MLSTGVLLNAVCLKHLRQIVIASILSEVIVVMRTSDSVISSVGGCRNGSARQFGLDDERDLMRLSIATLFNSEADIYTILRIGISDYFSRNCRPTIAISGATDASEI